MNTWVSRRLRKSERAGLEAQESLFFLLASTAPLAGLREEGLQAHKELVSSWSRPGRWAHTGTAHSSRHLSLGAAAPLAVGACCRKRAAQEWHGSSVVVKVLVVTNGRSYFPALLHAPKLKPCFISIFLCSLVPLPCLHIAETPCHSEYKLEKVRQNSTKRNIKETLKYTETLRDALSCFLSNLDTSSFIRDTRLMWQRMQKQSWCGIILEVVFQ